MACRFEIFFGSGDRLKVMAAHRALDEVERLERQMTVFSEESEISSLNRSAHQGTGERQSHACSSYYVSVVIFIEKQTVPLI